MLTITNKKDSNKYSGTVTLTDEQVEQIDMTFNSKYSAFKYGVSEGWTKKMIMKHCLDTTRDQYFYNYLNKLNGSK